MLWYEELELIEQHVKRTCGASFELCQSEACGWYTTYEVFGEDIKFVSRDYHNKADAINVLLEFLGE